MEGVSSINGATPTITTRLDGDTLLFYCAKQLNDLNSDIDVRLEQQQQMRDTKAVLNDIKPLIRTDESAISQEDREKFLTGMAQAILATPPGQDRDRLVASFQSFRQHACYLNAAPAMPADFATYLKSGYKDDLAKALENDQLDLAHNHLMPDDAKAIQESVAGVCENVGKNAELDMITLQDLISKRQMAIQCTTQIMAKFHQGFEAIANNIK